MSSQASEGVEPLETRRREAGASLRELLAQLDHRYPERRTFLDQAALALVAGEHQIVFGPPGTGKSELASALLNRFVDGGGRPSVYARQIVETTVQTDLIGPVDFKTLTETGRTVHHLDEGILEFEFAVLDEVFDGRDLLLRSILSILNERELALGPVVHRARLETALLTTNRYLSEVLAARPETLLAFSDRIAFACFVPKAFASPTSREALLAFAAGDDAEEPRTATLDGLHVLRDAAREVSLGREAREALAMLAETFAKVLGELAQERKGFTPTCFLSPRTLAKAVGVLRAAVVLDRYVGARDRPARIGVEDLGRLRLMFALGGPPADDLSRVVQATSDPREKWQLEIVRLENAAFDRALAIVAAEFQRRAESESKSIGLPELRARRRTLEPAGAADFALAAFQALGAIKSDAIRAEVEGIAREAALTFARAARRAAIPALSIADQPARLRACVLLANALRQEPEHAELAVAMARQALSEALGALDAVASGEAGSEFDAAGPSSLADLTQRATGLERRLAELGALASELEPACGDGRGTAEHAHRDACRRTARTLRRRAMVQLGGAARVPGGWDALAEASRQIAALDAALEKLSPGEGKVRSHVLAGRAGLLLTAAVELAPEGLAGIVGALQDGLARAEELGIERWRALKVCRPALERRLGSFERSLREVDIPEAEPDECEYLSLVGHCTAAANRVALARLVELLHLERDPLAARLDLRLARLELHELSVQVNFLARWLEDVLTSVPPPSSLATAAEAEAAWATVSASRFFAVGWRDRDLAALQARVAALTLVPELGREVEQVQVALDAVGATADRFGRALLERRAELAAA